MAIASHRSARFPSRMIPPSFVRRTTFAILLTALLAVGARGEVVINEVSAVQSERLLQHPVGAPPKLGALPAWHELAFAIPSWWGSGAGPIGFGYTQATNVQTAVQNKTPVLYLRREFSLSAAQAASAQSLELLLDYDDGFVAYLNGVEIARRNTGAAGSFAWHHQPAFNVKAAGAAETFALGSASGLLRTGANVLAIQVHNSNLADSRLFCSATLRLAGATPTNLVLPGDAWRWFAGTQEPAGGLYDGTDFTAPLTLGPNWTQLPYADGTWSSGPGGFGFDTAADYGPQIGTNLIAMQNVATAVYLRREFNLTAAEYEALTATSLTVDWDDGYVLYLNGYELSRANLAGAAGTLVPYNQIATSHAASRDNGGNNPAAIVSIPVPKNLLRPGRNVLSAQLHNAGSSNSDLLLDVRFSGTSGGAPLPFVAPGSPWRFLVATSEIGAFAPDAAGVIAPEFLDWLELKNTGAASADIGGWALTDSRGTPAKWVFPAGTTLPAGGFLVVACSGRDVRAPAPGALLHTNFSISSSGEYLALHDGTGALRSEMDGMPEQDVFHTWGIDPGSGQPRFLDRGTPGAENVPGTVNARTAEVDFDQPTGFHPTPPTVTLSTLTPGATIRYTIDGSEPTSTNGSAYTGPFNPITRPTTGPGTGLILREMFQWGAGTVVTPPNLPANATPTASQLITLFETPTGISDYYTHRVRGFVHPPATGNYEFYLATDDDGELWLSTDATPTNKRRIASIVGNWAGPRDWAKIATQRSVVIPLVAGQKYYIEALQSEGGGGDNCAVGWSGPGLPTGISVIDGRFLSPPDTLPPNTAQPPGGTTLRARAFAPGRLPSEVRTRTYVTGIDARLTTVPAFFMAGPGAETFYNGNGAFAQSGGNWNSGSWVPNDARLDYNFAIMHGEAFERPAAMEIVNPNNVLVERTNIGVRFAGSPWSRPQYQLQNVETTQWTGNWVNKPQINLHFRSDIGIGWLKQPGFIPTSKVKQWDTLRLRAGKNDISNPFIVDEWMRRSFAAMGAPAPQGFLATLFLNGQFKSYFNPTERPRGSFFQEFYGSGNAWDVNYIGDWEDGDATAFNTMKSFFTNTDFTAPANYQAGAALWDMSNIADYYIINGWGATRDWIDNNNNFTFARERAPGAKWRFSMWDAEGALGLFGQPNTHNVFETDALVPENGARNPTIGSDGNIVRQVFRRACQNAEFRLLFADRLQKHFFNGGAMSRTVMNARWTELRGKAEPLIAAVFGGGFNNGNWDAWANRDATFLQQARTAGLWPATVAPGMSPAGGTVGTGSAVTLVNSNPAGSTIYYTTTGVDPRAVGGAPQGTAYTGPVAVSGPLTLKARVRGASGEWSPVVEADFAPTPQRLLVTELNYNPPGADDLTEFVEITNVSAQPAPLNGAHFTAGIDFTFGNVTLAPGARVVLVRDAAAFAAAYPGVAIGGVFAGALDNGGETLTLNDIAEAVILTFTYGDSSVAGWPTSPDGDGATLVLRRPFGSATNPALAASWRASAADGGAPGAADSTVFAGAANADTDGDGFSALVEYALGTSDTSAASVPQMTTTRDVNGNLLLSVARSVAAEDVTVDALEASDLVTWQPAILQSETPEAGGKIRSVWRSTSAGPQTFLRLRVRMN